MISKNKSSRAVKKFASKNMDDEYTFMPLRQEAKFCKCVSQDCCCGENNVHEWAWDNQSSTYPVALSENNLEVKFHTGYSNGTAAVKGNKLLQKGQHHYWEVKMLTPMHGTDIMVGVGTSKVHLSSKEFIFCSFLGLDQESFGYSYQGYIQHGGEKREYGSCFTQGSIVGVHLDTWKGTLEFFLNRKSLGIAFTGLRNLMLYPMVSSTVAESRMRLTHSCSVPVSLQVECLSVLTPSQREYLTAMLPGLRHLTESIFADILQSRKNDDDVPVENELSYMILDDFDFALVGIKRQRTGKKARDNNSA